MADGRKWLHHQHIHDGKLIKANPDDNNDIIKQFKSFLPRWSSSSLLWHHEPISQQISHSNKIDNNKKNNINDNIDDHQSHCHRNGNYSLLYNDVSSASSIGEQIIELGCRGEESFVTIGRLESCDVVLDHDSNSRIHALIFYSDGSFGKKQGIYIVDCSSTHGTFVNRFKCESGVAYQLKNGYIIRFGLDINFYVVQCPDEDQELDISFTEMRKKLKERSKKSNNQIKTMDNLPSKSHDLNLWGQDKLSDNIFVDSSMPTSYELHDWLYQQYPGHASDVIDNFFAIKLSTEPNYDIQKVAKNLFTCELKFHPFSHRKDAMIIKTTSPDTDSAKIQCALEACKVIDAKGLLDDEVLSARTGDVKIYSSDSEEDEFMDQSGKAKEKREQRLMRKSAKDHTNLSKESKGFEQYLDDYKEIMSEIQKTNEKLLKDDELKSNHDINQTCGELDAIDNYMQLLQKGILTPQSRRLFKSKLKDLNIKKDKIIHFLRLLKPFLMKNITFEEILTDPFQSFQQTHIINDQEILKEKKQLKNAESSAQVKINEDNKSKYAKTIDEEVFVQDTIIEKPKIDVCSTSETFKIPNKTHSVTIDQSVLDCDKEGSYSTWLPPINQSGSGHTSLNDKYGY